MFKTFLQAEGLKREHFFAALLKPHRIMGNERRRVDMANQGGWSMNQITGNFKAALFVEGEGFFKPTLMDKHLKIDLSDYELSAHSAALTEDFSPFDDQRIGKIDGIGRRLPFSAVRLNESAGVGNRKALSKKPAFGGTTDQLRFTDRGSDHRSSARCLKIVDCKNEMRNRRRGDANPVAEAGVRIKQLDRERLALI
ncbi:MAG: hypothetical protein BWY50_01860 [Spirochaetes bacterium ADurb.Bin315]|nr:MAG: hypothetical protein BWY50_01860 [Spirochaetes bacterium ADurb.Bin315]